MRVRQEIVSGVEHLPVAETLYPKILGERLFVGFKEYDQDQNPIAQLSFLLRHSLVDASADGHPAYTVGYPYLTSPWHIDDHRGNYCATTQDYTENSPHIHPEDLGYPRFIITVTDHNHFYNREEGKPNILIAQDYDTKIQPYWFVKGADPISPNSLLDVLMVSDLLTSPSVNIHTSIQLWKLLPVQDQYQLQAHLKLQTISLRNYITVLGTEMQKLQQIEDAAQTRR